MERWARTTDIRRCKRFTDRSITVAAQKRARTRRCRRCATEIPPVTWHIITILMRAGKFALLLFLGAGWLSAQQTEASISGIIADGQGAAIVNAVVTAV